MTPGPSPAFLFYPGDWLASSRGRGMTAAERGFYIDLLAYTWRDHGLPDDDAELARLLGITRRAWAAAAARIRPHFISINGRLTNTRQEEERHKLTERSQRAAASANRRWNKSTHNKRNANAARMQCSEDNENAIVHVPTNDAPRLDQSFERFWAAYPRRQQRGEAERAWCRLAPTPDEAAAIVAAIGRQQGWPEWRRDGGRYIPQPGRWLAERRWQDEPPDVTAPTTTVDTAGIAAFVGGGTP